MEESLEHSGHDRQGYRQRGWKDTLRVSWGRIAAWIGPDQDFLKFWTGETVSLFGSHISYLALPLTAALALDATPPQMGYLNAARFAPFLIFTLLVGVWVDRRPRRPILIWTNLGRGFLIGLVPLMAVLGWLRLEGLYLVMFVSGVLTVFFELAYQAYLPSLVGRGQLTGANSRLQASASAAEIGGPGFAGLLIGWLTAPFAIAFDALSFLVSAGALALIRKPEPPPENSLKSRNLRQEVSEGLQITFGNPYLRAIAGEAATFNMAWQVMEAVFILYATRRLGLGPSTLGLIIAVGSGGALLGSLAAERLARRLGLGRAVLGSMFLACTAPILVPLAPPESYLAVVLPAVGHFLSGIGVAVSNVHVVSLRQAITPDHLLGRMTASYRMVIYGTLPLGALIGGFLGEAIGLRATLVVGVGLMILALGWVVFSPLPSLQRLPEAAGEVEA